jgi:hypothetical protein
MADALLSLAVTCECLNLFRLVGVLQRHTTCPGTCFDLPRARLIYDTFEPLLLYARPGRHTFCDPLRVRKSDCLSDLILYTHHRICV